MDKRGRFKGQEAVEFILIACLVFFAAFLIVMLLGGQISSFINKDSSIAQTSKKKANAISSTSVKDYGNTIETPSFTYRVVNNNNSPGTIGGSANTSTSNYPVTQNTDGSMSADIDGQTITLDSNILNNMNNVLQTTGSAGANELLKEIALLIEKYKPDFPDSTVPIEISFGTGARKCTDVNTEYKGKTTVNTISLKVDNHVVMFQNDHACTDSSGYYATGCAYGGLYRLEGDVNNGSFNGKVTSKDVQYNPKGNITGKVSLSNGFQLQNATYNQISSLNQDPTASYIWNMSFDNPSPIISELTPPPAPVEEPPANTNTEL